MKAMLLETDATITAKSLKNDRAASAATWEWAGARESAYVRGLPVRVSEWL